MNIRDSVSIYILQELNIPFSNEENKINLNDIIYTYQGNVENTKDHSIAYGIYNVNNQTSLFHENITVFEGPIGTNKHLT